MKKIQVALRVTPLNVIKQTTTAANQSQKASAATIIFLMGSHVLGQAIDPGRQNSDLYFGAARVVVALLKFADYLGFLLFGNCHRFRNPPRRPAGEASPEAYSSYHFLIVFKFRIRLTLAKILDRGDWNASQPKVYCRDHTASHHLGRATNLILRSINRMP